MNYYIPTIIRETSEGMTRLPIADVMLQRREIWLTGEITSELADAVIAQILHLDAEEPGEEITLYIQYGGGALCRRRPPRDFTAWGSDDTRPPGEWRHLRQRPGRAG